jgi:hypothetical protein
MERWAGGCVASTATAECGNFNSDNNLRSLCFQYFFALSAGENS